MDLTPLDLRIMTSVYFALDSRQRRRFASMFSMKEE